MRIETNGISLNVVESGSGPAVLLLHGFPDSAELWRHQISPLTEAGYRVIAPDLRGFGESDRPQGVENYAMETLLGDVFGLLDALEVPGAAVRTRLGCRSRLGERPAPPIGLASQQHVTGSWRYERIDGASHWIPLDASDRVSELLIGFLKGE